MSRRLLRGLVVALAAVLALAMAWVASNLVDSAPTELPSVLRLPAPAVPDDRNAFFVLVGVAAPPGADPSAWGRELWSAGEDDADSAWPAVKQPGHAVAWAVARRTWRVTAAILAADPSLLEPVSRATSALASGATDATRWMAFEANFARASFDEARGAACAASLETEGADRGLADRLVCRTGIGLLPNLTKTWSDAFWLQALAAAGQGLPQALSGPPFVEPQSEWPRLEWRNTLGGVLLDMAKPLYAPYVARQADVALHHAALQLAFALTREQVPVAERSEWLKAHVPAPQLRGRMRLEGDVLVVDHHGAHHGMDRPQDRIRIPLARV